ncbi:hypothetical protein ACQKKF_24720, partial [Pedobacter suwonensis]
FAQQLLLFSSNNSGGQFEIGERGSNLLVYALNPPIKAETCRHKFMPLGYQRKKSIPIILAIVRANL